jgi:hypothetical protein
MVFLDSGFLFTSITGVEDQSYSLYITSSSPTAFILQAYSHSFR